MEQEGSNSMSGAATFAFAFNEKNFSDRVLHFDIIPDGKEVSANDDGCKILPQRSTSTAQVQRKRKRVGSTDAAEESGAGPKSIPGDGEGGEGRADEAKEAEGVEEGDAGDGKEVKLEPGTAKRAKKGKRDKAEGRDAQSLADAAAEPLNGTTPEGTADVSGEGREQQDACSRGPHADGSEVAGERDQGGADVAPERGEEEPWEEETKPERRRRTVHINSAIVAAKSPFFFKLFSNGMRESDQREATLQIPASEEGPLMDVLEFMYSGAIGGADSQSVLAVLLVADKFEVVSCIRHCARLLSQMPMTVDLALLYLDLPSSVQAEAVKQLNSAAKEFLANHFRDLVKCGDEAMKLPLAGVEAILESDLLHVPTEDMLFDFVIKWSREKYADGGERQKVVAETLAPLIRFPQLSYRKLLRALTCGDLLGEVPKALVLEALHFKGEGHRGKLPSFPSFLDNPEAKQRRFRERAYKQRPIKYIVLDAPVKQCIAYLDLRLEELKALYPQGKLSTQPFCAGGHEFYLSAHCNVPEQGAEEAFGLFLGMFDKVPPPGESWQSRGVLVDYEFAVRMRNATSPVQYPFIVRSKSSYTFNGGKVVGYRNVLSTTWKAFTDDASPYFHNGVLHLRAELTIRSD